MTEFLATVRGKIVLAVIIILSTLVLVVSCASNKEPSYSQSIQRQAQVQPQVVDSQGQIAQQQAPVTYSQPAPVVVQQAPNHDGLLTGMLMGHMLSGGGNRSTVVEHRTIIQRPITTAPAQRYAAPVRAAPVRTAPVRVAPVVRASPTLRSTTSVGRTR